MTTKELLDEYFQGLAKKFGWQHLIANDFRFLGSRNMPLFAGNMTLPCYGEWNIRTKNHWHIKRGAKCGFGRGHEFACECNLAITAPSLAVPAARHSSMCFAPACVNRSIVKRNSCSLFPNVAYMLVRLMPIAFVRSANEAPSKPFSAKTRVAAMSASSEENSRGRPSGFSTFCTNRSVQKSPSQGLALLKW